MDRAIFIVFDFQNAIDTNNRDIYNIFTLLLILFLQ